MQQQADPLAPPFKPGQVISFEYPKSNQIDNRRPVFSRRTIAVTGIRDMGRTGLSPKTVRMRPMLARGRWLVTGICLDTGQERSFYVESMRDRQQHTWLTLGLFDPLTDNGPLVTDGIYAPTTEDRRFLCRVLEQFNAYDIVREPDPDDPNTLILGVFPL